MKKRIFLSSVLAIIIFLPIAYDRIPIPGLTLDLIAKTHHLDAMGDSSSPTKWLSLGQKHLLDQALAWMGQNLRCAQEGDESPPPFTWKDHPPPQGPCDEIYPVIFGRFGGPGPFELVLHVSGDSELVAHGTMLADEKYVYFTRNRGAFHGNVIKEMDGGSEAKLFKFSKGPDLLWIAESHHEMEDTPDEPNAYLFMKDGDTLKQVLAYPCGLNPWQSEDGIWTMLLPQDGRRLLLVTKDVTDKWDDQGQTKTTVAKITEVFYRWDPSAQKYKVNGPPKIVPEKIWDETKAPETLQ